MTSDNRLCIEKEDRHVDGQNPRFGEAILCRAALGVCGIHILSFTSNCLVAGHVERPFPVASSKTKV